MKIVFLSIVFFTFYNISNVYAFDFLGWSKSGNVKEDKKSDETEISDYEFFAQKINGLIAINNLKNVKVEHLNSIGVTGKILLENAAVFAAQFLKNHYEFAVNLLLTKLTQLKDELNTQKVENVENFVIFKALYIIRGSNEKVKSILAENDKNLSIFKFIKSTNSVNMTVSFDELRIPEQLFLSYIATKDYKYVKRLCYLYFDFDKELLDNAKLSFTKNTDFDEMSLDEKDLFKKYVFYLSSVKILKSNFSILRSDLYRVLQDGDTQDVVKNNLKNIIAEMERL